MKFIFKLTILILVYSQTSYAFNYRKCHSFLSRWGFPAGSTTGFQFTSSTGACSALALKEEEKKRFFVINYEIFQNEAAQGRGDYLSAFGQLSQCSKNESEEFNRRVKLDYENLFPTMDHENSFSRLDKLSKSICGKI